MASTYTSSLRLELQAEGENNNDWGDRANSDFQQIEQAIAGYTSIALTGATVTLTALNATTDQSRPAFLELVGTLTSNVGIIIPSVTKGYVIRNNTTGNFSVTMKCTAGTGLVLPQGGFCPVVCNGASVFQAVSRLPMLEVAGSVSLGSNLVMAGNLDVTGNTSLNGTLVVEGAASMGSTLTVGGAVSASSLVLTTPLSITAGGTGAQTAANARTNLGFNNAIVQVTLGTTFINNASSVQIPLDDTIPSFTEGVKVVEVCITPVTVTNMYCIRFGGTFTHGCSTTNGAGFSILRDGATAAIWAGMHYFPASQYAALVTGQVVVTVGNTTTKSWFRLHAGPQSNNDTLAWNGTGSSRIFGGVSTVWIEVVEFTP